MVLRVPVLVPVIVVIMWESGGAKKEKTKVKQEFELHEDNWDETVKGKQLFLKFFSPGCGHCKKMKPAWKKLEQAFESTPTAVIAGVDCEGKGESICTRLGIESYPTLKYGTADGLEEYEGDRDFRSLKTFADKKVIAPCGAEHPHHCNAEKRALLEAILSKSKDELKQDVKQHEAAIRKAKADFKQFGKDLHAKYEQQETGSLIDQIRHLPKEQQVTELERINKEMAEKEDPLKRVERIMKKIKKENDAAEKEMETKVKALEDKVWAAKSVLALPEPKKEEL